MRIAAAAPLSIRYTRKFRKYERVVAARLIWNSSG
jgi:hypothetical protein